MAVRLVDRARPAECGVRESCTNLEVFRGVSGLVGRFWAGLRARYAPRQDDPIWRLSGPHRRTSRHLGIAERATLRHYPNFVYASIEAIDSPTSFSSLG